MQVGVVDGVAAAKTRQGEAGPKTNRNVLLLLRRQRDAGAQRPSLAAEGRIPGNRSPQGGYSLQMIFPSIPCGQIPSGVLFPAAVWKTGQKSLDINICSENQKKKY